MALLSACAIGLNCQLSTDLFVFQLSSSQESLSVGTQTTRHALWLQHASCTSAAWQPAELASHIDGTRTCSPAWQASTHSSCCS